MKAPFPLRIKALFKNSKGIALLQALFLVMLITFIVNQVNFEAAVEYTINAQTLQRVKAYQAAKAGVELSRLRINLYHKASALAKNIPGADPGSIASTLKMIYSLPVQWPIELPTELSAVDQDSLKKIGKESLMQATYGTQIQSEDFLNINDLGVTGPQSDKIKLKLQDLFKGKVENDPEWADKNRGVPFEEIINNIKDWIDGDTESGNGGAESEYYSKLRDWDPDIQDTFPPNRFFRTMDEVRMVPGVTDEIFAVIRPAFSVFGLSGIDPNSADQGAIKSLHKSFTDELVTKILNRRDDPAQGGPFKDKGEFFSYLSTEGINLTQEEQDQMPLRLPSTTPCSFRISSTGKSGEAIISITAVTYDVSCAQVDLSTQSAGGNTAGGNGNSGGSGGSNGGTNGGNGSSPAQKPPKGPPRIVYWSEK